MCIKTGDKGSEIINLKWRLLLSVCVSLIIFAGIVGNYALAAPITNNQVLESANTVPYNYTVWNRIPAEKRLGDTVVATKTIRLVSKPHGTNVIDTIYAGTKLKEISCVTYTHPSKHAIEVTRVTNVLKQPGGKYNNPKDRITLYPGTYVYLVMYIGEGYYYALYNNQLISVPPCIENLDGYKNPWGRYVGETTDKDLNVDLWMCYSTSDGTVGWTYGRDNVTPEWNFKYSK